MNDEERRRILQLLEDGPERHRAGECSPPLDAIETERALEIVLDVPGVALDSLSVSYSRGALVIAGHKLPGGCEHHAAAFHLAERSFGHFARAVRLGGAYDAGAARATLAAGELRIILPRIGERRGAEIRIPVQAG